MRKQKKDLLGLMFCRRELFALLAAGALRGAESNTERASSAAFVEVPPSKSGITWVHDAGASTEHYLPETLPPGCAFFDYDNDGWMDVFLVNSGPSDFFTPKKPLRHALYRNNRNGTFTDVTVSAGVAGGNSYGMGVAIADFDNDGFQDILVTAYGPPTLYKNNGDGTFTDVTNKSGLSGLAWTTSAVWFDYDNDGLLDLFLCSFVRYGPGDRFVCGDNKLGRKYYCIPRVFKPTPSHLYRNRGDGTFELVSKGTDIEKALGKALGVVATDINNDGLMDLFVANDTVQNFLFMNRGKGRWEEIGLPAEVAFSANGQARSGMGVDSADINGDGWQDLFVANVDQEMFSLYENNKNETFIDAAHRHTVATATRLLSGWGLRFFDYDNDGLTDLLLANGHPDDMIEMYSQQVKYKEPLLLFHNEGGKFRNVSETSGAVFSKAYPARGLATGDFDNDGRVDVLIGNCNEAPALLRNTAGGGNGWIGLHLQGTTCNRDAIGARIRWSVNGKSYERLKKSGGSYLSSHDPREVLGLGATAKVDWIAVRWPGPSTRVERFVGLKPGRYHNIVEGSGEPVRP